MRMQSGSFPPSNQLPRLPGEKRRGYFKGVHLLKYPLKWQYIGSMSRKTGFPDWQPEDVFFAVTGLFFLEKDNPSLEFLPMIDTLAETYSGSSSISSGVTHFFFLRQTSHCQCSRLRIPLPANAISKLGTIAVSAMK